MGDVVSWISNVQDAEVTTNGWRIGTSASVKKRGAVSHSQTLKRMLRKRTEYFCASVGQRHLLPFQMGQGDFGPDGPMTPGRPRPHYTYSRKSNLKQDKGQNFGLDFTDNEDDDFQPVSAQ